MQRPFLLTIGALLLLTGCTTGGAADAPLAPRPTLTPYPLEIDSGVATAAAGTLAGQYTPQPYTAEQRRFVTAYLSAREQYQVLFQQITAAQAGLDAAHYSDAKVDAVVASITALQTFVTSSQQDSLVSNDDELHMLDIPGRFSAATQQYRAAAQDYLGGVLYHRRGEELEATDSMRQVQADSQKAAAELAAADQRLAGFLAARGQAIPAILQPPSYPGTILADYAPGEPITPTPDRRPINTPFAEPRRAPLPPTLGPITPVPTFPPLAWGASVTIGGWAVTPQRITATTVRTVLADNQAQDHNLWLIEVQAQNQTDTTMEVNRPTDQTLHWDLDDGEGLPKHPLVIVPGEVDLAGPVQQVLQMRGAPALSVAPHATSTLRILLLRDGSTQARSLTVYRPIVGLWPPQNEAHIFTIEQP